MMKFPLQLQTIVIGEQNISFFAPDAPTIKEAYESGVISFPYWSKVWAAAIGLSEFILRQPQYVKNKSVLELGAGLGLPSLVAARYAKHVLCTDSSEEAVAVVAQSAAHHHLKNFTTGVLDWKDLPRKTDVDVLLLSDVNYEPASFSFLAKTIETFLENGGVALLSTPQRLVAKAFVEPLLADCVCKEEYNVKQGEHRTAVTVLALEQKQK